MSAERQQQKTDVFLIWMEIHPNCIMHEPSASNRATKKNSRRCKLYCYCDEDKVQIVCSRRTKKKKTDRWPGKNTLAFFLCVSAQRDDPNSFILMIIRSHEDRFDRPAYTYNAPCAITDTGHSQPKCIVSKTNAQNERKKRKSLSLARAETHVETSNHHQCTSCIWSPGCLRFIWKCVNL